MKVDRSILSSNNQSIGQTGDPDKLESSITHLADVIDALDNEKTVKTGNHEGTWQGLTPAQASEAINGARLDKLETKYLAWYTTTVGKTLASSVWTRLTFDSAKVNQGAMYKTGDTFVIKESGWHKFSANILVHLQASAGAYVEVWQVGGAAVKRSLIGIFGAVGESWNSPSGHALINCTVGEEFEFVIRQTSTDSRPLNTYNCFVERL